MFKRFENKETLVRIKRWPNLINRFEKVRIFSAEHGYYWRGDGNGYTSNPEESSVKTMAEAYEQTKHCGKEKGIQYIAA